MKLTLFAKEVDGLHDWKTNVINSAPTFSVVFSIDQHMFLVSFSTRL